MTPQQYIERLEELVAEGRDQEIMDLAQRLGAEAPEAQRRSHPRSHFTRQSADSHLPGSL
jgi:hypothetical protein